jgi:D-beta-D-heptose 7-phosphate kinase/D-beta-D-heptose 1-phosphate adenosyltransferase
MSINNTGILVIGDVMLDRYWFGVPKALAEEAPVAVLTVNKSEDRAGGAANVAINIKKLSGDINVAILAPLGQDNDGAKLKDILTRENIQQYWQYKNMSHVTSAATTITKHRMLSRKQQLVRVDFEQKYHPIELNQTTKDIINNYKVIVCSDYNKGSLDNCQEIIAYARSLGKLVLVDPKGIDFTKYQTATMLTPNYKEFTDVVGHDILNFDRNAYNLINKLELEYLLVTCGSDGMILYGKNNFKYSASSYANQVYDVTGAGDTVIASIAVSLANDQDKIDATERASHAAAVVVSKVGTGHVTIEEINNQIAKYNDTQETSIIKNKIFNISSEQELNDFKNSTNNNIYYWDWKAEVINATHIKNLLKLKDNNDKLNPNSISVVLKNNEQLAYMISKISIVDKVICCAS